MALPSLVIWGAGGHARVVADIVRLEGRYVITGFLDDVKPRRAGDPFADSVVLGGSERLAELRAAGVEYLIVAIGDCAARLNCAQVAREAGLTLAIAIHSSAIIAQDSRIGAGTVIAAGAIVNPAAVVGENVIVNTASSVDHDCVIGDGAHISPGARVGGNVHVGRGAWVGISATVRDRIRIGEGAVVGAGAVVVRDIPPHVMVYGNPARVQRTL